jgi:hypothetical protein
MALNRVARWLSLALVAGATWIGFSAPAQAIPVFARQTGHNCQACHISYPELTAYGREFKLNGYTFGEAQPIPLAFAIMGEYDHVGKGTDATTGAPTCSSAGGAGPASCNHLELVQYSVFFGGRISDNFGMFGQLSGGEFPIAAGGGGTVGGGFSPTADNTEFRYVHRITSDDSLEPDAVIGFNMNNNPTMQDVWQSAPAWRFPWFPYMPAGYGALAAPYIDNPTGGHNKVGTGMYAWVHKSFYAELELYHAATGMLSFLNWGNGGTLAGMGDNPSDVLAGENPYYRFAYSHDWGYNSVEVGLFGMHSKVYNCNPGGTGCAPSLIGQTNNYNDIAIDSQYQYNKSEPWVFGANASFIHEKNSLLPLFQEGSVAAIDHTVNELQARATAYYLRQYGATLGYSSLSGTSDAGLYPMGSGGSATGSPRSSWWTVELNYLPMQDLRFSLLLQDFTKINGGSANFDGAGNNASDQRRVSLAIWWVF